MKENLVEKAKHRDETAFNKLVDVHKKELYLIAKSILKQEADVEDAIQETLFHIYKDIWRLKNENSFKTWSYKILINSCNNILRNNKNELLSFEYESIERLQDDNNDYCVIEGEQNFLDMIEILDEYDKEILILKYSRDFNNREIGKLLNMNDGTVRTRIYRSKEKIRNNMKLSRK